MRDNEPFETFSRTSRGPNLEEGMIAFLPTMDLIEPDDLPEDPLIDGGFYDHPVVILTKHEGGDWITIAPITSFNGKDLNSRFPNCPRSRSHYLPIWPSGEHPESQLCLYLEGGAELPKKSYVKIVQTHLIKESILRPYRGSRYFFAFSSLALLNEYTDTTSSFTRLVTSMPSRDSSGLQATTSTPTLTQRLVQVSQQDWEPISTSTSNVMEPIAKPMQCLSLSDQEREKFDFKSYWILVSVVPLVVAVVVVAAQL